MSEYTDNMTTEDMRKEIAEMIQCGEGFIATDEKLLEYVDDFISKVRADVIEEVIKAIDEQNYCMQEECHFNACRSEGCPVSRNAEVIFQTWLKKLKEQKNE